MKRILPLALGLIVTWSHASSLRPFTTDYCTGYPEGPLGKKELWKHCCLIHDMYFWAGGSKKDRDNADLELKSCVEETGERIQSVLIYLAVHSGKYSPVKIPGMGFNNGWTSNRSHLPLSYEEIETVEAELDKGYDFIPPHIKEHFILKLRSRMD